MLDRQTPLHERAILDVIETLASNGETGKLEIGKGSTEAVFFFRNGKLLDARVGHLTGFQAINAVASMRDVHFNFDASVVPPLSSSITPSERVVLKQFFGIETVAPEEIEETIIRENIPVYSDDARVPARANEEVAVVQSDVASDEVPVPEILPDTTSSKFLYRGGLVIAVLFILLAVAAVTLRNQFRERAAAPVVAAAVETSSTAVPEEKIKRDEVKQNEVKRDEVKQIEARQDDVKRDAVKQDEAKRIDVKQDEVKRDEVKQDEVERTDAAVAAAPDLSGKWNVVNTVQKTSYRSFENLQIGFRLSIRQDGTGFTGTGEKISENGRSLPAGSRTPISVKGSINGGRVEATFFEEGAARKTNGRFVWTIDKTGSGLSGTFISTAARTSGKSAARREL